MIGILLSLFLLQAGAPMGAVTGVVRSAAGMPAAGVRVYAQQVREATDANSPAPLEGLVQTDASGRYRLELSAGRYYIASGSVSAPTYYPGTTDVASARLITVTPGGVTEGIDFGSFVPASTRPTGITLVSIPLPAPAGAFQGTVRFPDGTPAANARVVAYPASNTVLPAAALAGSISARLTQSDTAGRYLISSVPLGEYHIVAGYAETLGFFADANATQPRTIRLTSPTRIDSLDISLPISPTRTGTTVAGTVFTKDGVPAAGSLVRISRPRASASVTLPSINAVPDTTVRSDGTFTFTSVVPGFYIVQVSFSNVNSIEAIDVGSSAVTNLQFSLPIAMVSGHIVMEDGSPILDAQLFVSGMLTLAGNPNLILSTVLPLAAGGVFAGVPDKGDSRFYFRNVPDEYEVRSIKAGSVDLMKEALKFDGTQSVFIEARVARRGTMPTASSVRVIGTTRDGSGAPSAVARVELCCLHAGLMDAVSAPIRPDGSFEFTGIPPGKYTPEFRTGTGQSAIRVMSATVERGSDGVRLQLVSGTVAPLIPAAIDIPTVP